ncbi:hypothetical protein [Methylosinus sp. Sm6]|uniref:hypothetical protein n=1 Tax=Methylosinus sp. Sm6 TaxID=2866948 RepID=UPI001C991FE1|nr:hypothetical protein [Methylosinus sp. Sm6]MBY6243577.1 hypothetical protein [Methylosinus sp. Sm6]
MRPVVFARMARLFPLAAAFLLAAGFGAWTETSLSGSETWELAEASKYPDPQLVRLNIPKRYAYHTPDSSGPHKGPMYFFAFYPDFSSVTDPQNADVNPYRCPGYCNGLLIVYLENVGLHRGNTSATELFAHHYLRKRAAGDIAHDDGRSTKFIEQPPKFGFDVIFDEVTTYIGKITINNKYMIKYTNDKTSYSLVAECNMYANNNKCHLIFSPQCAPEMEVEVGPLEYSKMELSLDIWNRADKFISAMIQNDNCKPK